MATSPPAWRSSRSPSRSPPGRRCRRSERRLRSVVLSSPNLPPSSWPPRFLRLDLSRSSWRSGNSLRTPRCSWLRCPSLCSRRCCHRFAPLARRMATSGAGCSVSRGPCGRNRSAWTSAPSTSCGAYPRRCRCPSWCLLRRRPPRRLSPSACGRSLSRTAATRTTPQLQWTSARSQAATSPSSSTGATSASWGLRSLASCSAWTRRCAASCCPSSTPEARKMATSSAG
mmetsp:Transcript_96495/g.270048  ORF Transcript_96495/g.270048 Transcript_96495/m.270048 type:complete len:228 (+) Transcript_96495:456-1139(+)